MDALAHAHTRLLGTYTPDDGHERHVLALESSEGDILQIVDALPDPPGGDPDRRPIENRVSCLAEAYAIADDYITLANKLGWPPMPDVWW